MSGIQEEQEKVLRYLILLCVVLIPNQYQSFEQVNK